MAVKINLENAISNGATGQGNRNDRYTSEGQFVRSVDILPSQNFRKRRYLELKRVSG